MLRSSLVASILVAVCLSVVASAAAASPAPSSTSTWLTGDIVAIEISNADPSIVTVVVYDPLSGSSLSSAPIPGWWGSDPSVILDGTSAKSVAWSGDIDAAAPEAYVAFFIQNNASSPQQAFFTYQFSDESGYIKPIVVSSCVSKAPLLTDLQYFSAQDGALPFVAAYVDMTQVQQPDTEFAFMWLTLPSSVNLDEVCTISPLPSSSPPAPLPVPWSVSAVVATVVPGWTPLVWAYIGYENSTASGSNGYDYSIQFVPFEASGGTPDPIPLTGALAPSKLPPEPWFSLHLVPNNKQLGRQTDVDLWLVNSIDQTVYAITLDPSRVVQLLTQSGLPFVVPTIPAAVTWTATPVLDQSMPIFLHLNDYKQLMGACPANASISITGVNLQQLAWGQKLNFNIRATTDAATIVVE